MTQVQSEQVTAAGRAVEAANISVLDAEKHLQLAKESNDVRAASIPLFALPVSLSLCPLGVRVRERGSEAYLRAKLVFVVVCFTVVFFLFGVFFNVVATGATVGTRAWRKGKSVV